MWLLNDNVNGTGDDNYAIENVVVIFHEAFHSLAHNFDDKFNRKVAKKHKVAYL